MVRTGQGRLDLIMGTTEGYYRPKSTNPNWIEGWGELDESSEEDWQEVLDQLCELACGVKVGASDQCQRNAKHIHAHLAGAFYAGLAYGRRFGSKKMAKKVLKQFGG